MRDELMVTLSNYKSPRSAVLPGAYRVQVEDVEATESVQMHPMVNIWFKILDGDQIGRTVTDRIVLIEASKIKLEQFSHAAGLPLQKNVFELDISQLVGRVLEIDVADGDLKNGRAHAKVRGYRKLDRTAP